MIQEKILNILLLVRYYYKIISTLKNKNIINIKLFNFQNWHLGYAYFIGTDKGEKVANLQRSWQLLLYISNKTGASRAVFRSAMKWAATAPSTTR